MTDRTPARSASSGATRGVGALRTAGTARSLASVVAAAALALLSAGCVGSPDTAAPPLSASTTQFRFNEGTKVLRTGVVNEGHRPVRINTVALHWPGFEGPLATVHQTLRAGEIAAFDLSYGDARCESRPVAPARLDVMVDSRRETIPVKVEYPGLLLDLWKRECATQRLDRAATVTLVPGHLAADGYRTHVLLRRQSGTRPVTLVDVLGSVNLVLEARTPTPLRGRATKVPLLVHPSLRCDAHAMSQSSQPFLFSAWATVGHSPPVRVFLRVTPAIRAALERMIDRDCLS